MISDINLGAPEFNYESRSFSDEIIENETDSNDDSDNNNNNNKISNNLFFVEEDTDIKMNKKYRHSQQIKKILLSKNDSINVKKRHSIINNHNLLINKILVCQRHFNLIQSSRYFKKCFSEQKISIKMDSIVNKLKILICDDESFTAISKRNVVIKYFKSKNKNISIIH
jgi:hypothetical protein